MSTAERTLSGRPTSQMTETRRNLLTGQPQRVSSTAQNGGTTSRESARGTHPVISISTLFGVLPSPSSGRSVIDIILISNDLVVFYADESTLLNASTNSFKGLLPIQTRDRRQRLVFLNEVPSSELQAMLQCVYNVAHPRNQIVDFGAVLRGIDRLPAYGVVANGFVIPYSSLFDYILSMAPIHPLECYTLAASHDMRQLAIEVSSHTLVVELSSVTEEMADKMGSIYLLKLFRLHGERKDALRRMLMVDLDVHYPTEECGFEEQKESRKAWNNAVADLTWGLRANTPTTMIRETIMVKTSTVECKECIKIRDSRLTFILREWSLSSRTI